MTNEMNQNQRMKRHCRDPKCKDHAFCIRDEPTLIHDPKTIEFNPINPFIKYIPTDYDEHLRQQYYYRDIMAKKKALKEGDIGPEDFEDDGQIRYESDPNSNVIKMWQ
jgi:hypothetical protein